MINSELDDNPLTLEEQMVASTVASLRDNIGNNKRTRMDYHCQDDDQDQDRGMTANEPAAKKRVIESEAEVDDDPSANDDNAFQDYPYFGYRDYSQEPDPDPLIPLTAPGRVPNFPAKMHVILSQPELQDIVAWLPHGRSWRVLRPREFEVKVLPTYFDHGKFSSFIRQANGWGFRRITQGML
mgnify:CR=1 FL=1